MNLNTTNNPSEFTLEVDLKYFYLCYYCRSGTANVGITMKSVGTIRDFYSFGIYGHHFNLDETSGANNVYNYNGDVIRNDCVKYTCAE